MVALTWKRSSAWSRRSTEPNTHTVPLWGSGRTWSIEPWLTDQWYVEREATLAKPCDRRRCEAGRTRFVPENYDQDLLTSGLRNIQPWCISRQLWWGHQIPAWYDSRRRPSSWKSSETEDGAQAAADGHYGKPP